LDNINDYGIGYKNIVKDIDILKKDSKDIGSRLIIIEECSKNMNKRIDSFEKHTEAVIHMGVNIKALTNTIGELVKRVTNLEDAPGKIAIKSWVWVLCTIGASVIGIVLGRVI